MTQRLEALEAQAARKSEALRSLEARRPFGIPTHGLADVGEVHQGVVTWESLQTFQTELSADVEDIKVMAQEASYMYDIQGVMISTHDEEL